MKCAVLALAKRGIELHFVGVRNAQQAEIEEAVDVGSKQEAVGHLIVRSCVVRGMCAACGAARSTYPVTGSADSEHRFAKCS